MAPGAVPLPGNSWRLCGASPQAGVGCKGSPGPVLFARILLLVKPGPPSCSLQHRAEEKRGAPSLGGCEEELGARLGAQAHHWRWNRFSDSISSLVSDQLAGGAVSVLKTDVPGVKTAQPRASCLKPIVLLCLLLCLQRCLRCPLERWAGPLWVLWRDTGAREAPLGGRGSAAGRECPLGHFTLRAARGFVLARRGEERKSLQWSWSHPPATPCVCVLGKPVLASRGVSPVQHMAAVSRHSPGQAALAVRGWGLCLPRR